jgi:hypothetical protein
LGYGDNFIFKKIYLPLVQKNGFFYSEASLKKSFFHIKNLIPENQEKIITKKIFVGRKKFPYANNQSMIIEEAISNGFQIIYPEEMSLANQVQLFRAAEIIAGEDSSALHNIGFSEKSPLVMILARGDRYNFWHIPVAKTSNATLKVFDNIRNDKGYSFPSNFFTKQII